MERRGRGARPAPRSKPVKEGDVVEVEIVEKSRRGDGVARVEGLVIFVPGAEPGQRVKVQIEKVGDTYAVGRLTQ